MDGLDDEEDNAQEFECKQEEENEEDDNNNENEQKELINEKIDKTQNNLEESWILNIEKYLEEINENSGELALKLNQVCKELKFYENSKRLDLIKKIIKDAYSHSKINFVQRMIDFSEFILSEKKLEYDVINEAVNNINLNNIKLTNKDIIYFWKEYIIEKYCSFLTDKNNLTSHSKKIIKSLLEENYNIAEIYSILYPFRSFLVDENVSNIEILESIFSIIVSYRINEINDYLKKIINKNIIENKAKNTFELNQKVALEFYLTASENKNSESNDLTIPQLLQSLKNMNSELTDDIIREREEQLNDIESIINNSKYKDYEKQDFQRWTQKEFPKLDFVNNINESISKVLGMISLVIKKEKGYYLRNAQLIAILMFIGKEKKFGLIEEISTGEGKSCIICSLSIYFSLLKKKVDIISSSYSLAQRDSETFENIYDYFNLTTSYPKDSDSNPYKCDILYGTFLEFEGDCLRELISDKNIRNNRPFEVIIIDEVDNLFIDNILSSTRLTGSTKGFKFLIPLYLSAYLSFELYDYIFLFFFSMNLKNVNEEKRKKYEKLIKEPEYRKKIIINLTKNMLNSLDNKSNPDDLRELELDKIEEKDIEKGNKMMDNVQDFIQKLEEYLKYPDFLESFVKSQNINWLNNAFKAKNYMNKYIDYVITEGKNRDIAPVDRENTGETELSTVYSDGLHQMLEIKEKLRIKDETLTDTFLSHISFFQKYKNNDEFLFFGLTGTIGDSETQKIYQTDYFNSKLLFIPQYKKKRFIELPPKLSNILQHSDNICKDIIINYSYGRRILVICESIKEARDLHKKLLDFDIKAFKEEYPFIKLKEDYKNFVLLYTRSDTSEKDNYKNKVGKIILSTNIGGRGTDIKTTEDEEENGGMHVILTSMPSNYRVLKQAFGRTSREGKKGTGQIILKQISNESYSDVIYEMNKNEKERIENIQKHLKIILFKDELFIEFCGVIKGLDKDSCLFHDIKERWAMFLKKNISKYNIDNFNAYEIKSEFNDFKKEIEEAVNMKEDYKKYTNPFIKVQAGLREYKNFENQLNNYLDFNMKNKRFFFVIPYLKAIILIKNQKSKYDDEFYDKLINYLTEAKNSITILIEKSIDPVLESFSEWNKIFKNFRLEINDENKIDEELYDMEINALKREDLLIQYQNIKNILEKIKEKIKFNLLFVILYRIKYNDNQRYIIHIIKKDLDEGLKLDESEIKELQFFYDASFYYIFDFEKQQKIVQSFFKKFLRFILGLVLLPLAKTALLIRAVPILAFMAGKKLVDKLRIRNKGNLEIGNNSIFSGILRNIITKFKNEEVQQRALLNIENENQDDIISYKSLKKSLKMDVFEKIELEFMSIKKINIVKFLLFIDIYLSNEFWNKKIYQIIRTNFENIYKTKFNENINLIRRKLSKENYEEIKKTLISIFVLFWNKCLLDFDNMKKKKEYNEETGINSLEHLIRKFNPKEITEEIIEETFNQILQYKIIDINGFVNKNLFKECFIQNTEQKFAINITTNIKKEEFKKLSKLNDFVITGIDIPNISSYFLDLMNFYKKKGYNIEKQKKKDYTLFIINNIKDIINKMLLLDDKLFNVVFQRLLNDIKILVNKLLDEKVFSQSSIRNVEKEMQLILTEEEKREFKSLIDSAEENIKSYKKKKK